MSRRKREKALYRLSRCGAADKHFPQAPRRHASLVRFPGKGERISKM
jgi:hypothetical protein